MLMTASANSDATATAITMRAPMGGVDGGGAAEPVSARAVLAVFETVGMIASRAGVAVAVADGEGSVAAAG
jgi:hypothetical protein